MPEWTILHLVRYPPFDDKRLHAEEVPILKKSSKQMFVTKNYKTDYHHTKL